MQSLSIIKNYDKDRDGQMIEKQMKRRTEYTKIYLGKIRESVHKFEKLLFGDTDIGESVPELQD